MSASMTATTTLPRTLARSARLRRALGPGTTTAGRVSISLLAVLALVTTTLLVLAGALLGGRAFVSAADGVGLVQQPGAVVSAQVTSEEREDVTTGRPA